MAANVITKLIPDRSCNFLDEFGINLDDVTEIKVVVRNLNISPFRESPYSVSLDLDKCKKLLQNHQEDICRYRYKVKKYPLAISITTRCHGGGYTSSALAFPISANRKYLLHPGRSKPVKCYTSFNIRSLIAMTSK